MKMEVYAIRDKVVGELAPPFAAKNDEAAVRAFRTVQFPKGSPKTDFELVKLFGYDSEASFPVVYEGEEDEKDK